MTESWSGAVVITGGGSGIGRATALTVARRGAGVAVLDLDLAGAQQTAAEAESAGAPGAIAVACDVRDEAAVEAAVTAASELGAVRGLVACAGIDRGAPAHELDLELWNSVIGTNLTGTFLSCKHVLRRMLEHGSGGSIVCASSPWARVATPGGVAAYCATKAGISALVRSLALDYAAAGIRVNAIVPGATETPLMWATTPPAQRPELRALVGSQIALGRLAEPAEIAEAIAWLLSARSSYVTGSDLVVDGGVLARASIAV